MTETASQTTRTDSERPRVRLIGTRSSQEASAPSAETAARSEPALLPRTMAERSSTPSNPAYLTEMLAVMSTIALLLAARLLLLLAVLGAFALAFLAHWTLEPMSLWLNIAYDVLVVIPLVFLYWTRG